MVSLVLKKVERIYVGKAQLNEKKSVRTTDVENNKTNIITFPTYLEMVRNIFDLLKLYA